MNTETLENKLLRGKNAIMHPVRITTISGLLTVPSMGFLFSPATSFLSPPLLLISYIGDALDGSVARKYGNKTKQGAIIDPYMDKFRNLLVGGYILGATGLTNPLLSASILSNFAVDYISQKKRGDLLEQTIDCIKYTIHCEECDPDLDKKSTLRANNLGKIKTVIQSVVNIGYVTKEAYLSKTLENFPLEYVDNLINYGFAFALITSAALGYKGLKKRN